MTIQSFPDPFLDRPLRAQTVSDIWITAALSLPFTQRIEAYRDIAELLGTTYARVLAMASQIKARDHTALTESGYGVARQAYTAAPYRPGHRLPITAGRAG